MKQYNIMAVAVCATAMWAVPVIAQTSPAVYDAVKSFSFKTNTTTSRWSYVYTYSSTRDGNYTLVSSVAPASVPISLGGVSITYDVWTPSGNTAAGPDISVNQYSSPLASNFGEGPITIPAACVLLNVPTPPNSSTGYTGVRFLAPKAGTLHIVYSFDAIDPYGGDGIVWYVDLNNGLNGDLATGSLKDAASGFQNLTVKVAAGDYVDFLIGGNNGWTNDTTALTVSIVY